MSNKLYHYLYRTTNLINGRFYIGKHSSKLENDRYYGSGKVLKAAINKYSKNNFKKEIISRHDSENDAYYAESLIVTKEFIAREDTYNLRLGGHGGSWTAPGNKPSEETLKKMSIANSGKNNGMYGSSRTGKDNPMYGKTQSQSAKNKMSKTKENMSSESRSRMSVAQKGRESFSQETRNKMSAAHKGKKYKPQKQVKCPHCDKIGATSGMTQWHFDNCKKKVI